MDESVEDISPEELMERIERERYQEQQNVNNPNESRKDDEFDSFGTYSPTNRRFRRSKYNNNNMETPFSEEYSELPPMDGIDTLESYGRKSYRNDRGGRGDGRGGRNRSSDRMNGRRQSSPNESQNSRGGSRNRGSQSGAFGSQGSSGSSGSQGGTSGTRGNTSGASVGRRVRDWRDYDDIPNYLQYDLVDDYENAWDQEYPLEEYEYPQEQNRKYNKRNRQSSEVSNSKYKEKSNMHYIENSPLAFNGGFGGGIGSFGFGGLPYGGYAGGDASLGLLALALAGRGDRGGYCGPFAGNHSDGNASAAAIAAIALGNRDCDGRRRGCDDHDGHELLAGLIGMDKLGDIEGAIALSALSTQKAVSDGTASVNDTIVQSAIANLKGHADLALGIANAVSTAKDMNAIQTATLSGLINDVGNQVDRNLFTLTATVKDDGEKTRALITANQIAELNRIAQERQDEIIELKSEARRRDDRHGIEINMINNQNQNQLQFQAQAQALGQIGHHLAACSQRIDAQNTAINVGGTQVAGQSSTNNNNNVRT